ncbi:MAG: heat-inducible transcriptional repressor HrcA, partial [Pseudomonadota bacterium]
MPEPKDAMHELNDRSREVFRRVVEGYLESGGPVGSRSLTRTFPEKISAATIRNVMQDLEFLGLLDSPHVSAGRIPTELGLRIFVDGFLEVGNLNEDDRDKIDATLGAETGDTATMLDRVGAALSGATRGASLVLAPKHEAPIRHIEFVSLGPDRALVVLVFADGEVENRIFEPPPGQTPSSMREAANFINAVAEGRTLSELGRVMGEEIRKRRLELDALASEMVERGIALWENEGQQNERLIVRGRSNLLEETANSEDFERIRSLFDDLERK